MLTCIVLRQLQGLMPVVCTVIEEPDYTVDDLDAFFKEAAEEWIEKFKAKFVEFGSATFYVQVFNTLSKEVVTVLK